MPDVLINLAVNGQKYILKVGAGQAEVDPSHTLAHTLRENLGLTGTKVGCNRGECGACTVLLDGKPVLSCITLSVACDGKSITTIEGLEDPHTGELDPVQQSFLESGAFQCGFCTPGMIMSVKALLRDIPEPTDEQIREALSGHFCRCITHYHVLEAVGRTIRKSR